jgi:exonuclease SbcC
VLSKREDDGQFISVVDKRNEVPKENARIIGLNFDQFLRSILLSQGDFARFLKSNANERGELLEKITGTEIYRQLGRACYERRGKELKELEYLNIQLEGIEILSEEECKQLKDELDLLNKNSKISEEKITQLRKHLQTIQEHNQLSVSIEKSKEQLTQLNTEMEAFKADKGRLEKHQNVLPLKAEILAVEQSRKSIRDKQKEEAEKNKQLQHENASTELTQKQLVELERKVDDFNKKQEETKLLIKKVRDLDSEIKVAQNSYQSLEEQNLSMGKQVDALYVEIKSLEENLVEKEKELSGIKNFLEKNKQLNGVSQVSMHIRGQIKRAQT